MITKPFLASVIFLNVLIEQHIEILFNIFPDFHRRFDLRNCIGSILRTEKMKIIHINSPCSTSVMSEYFLSTLPIYLVTLIVIAT